MRFLPNKCLCRVFHLVCGRVRWYFLMLFSSSFSHYLSIVVYLVGWLVGGQCLIIRWILAHKHEMSNKYPIKMYSMENVHINVHASDYVSINSPWSFTWKSWKNQMAFILSALFRSPFCFFSIDFTHKHTQHCAEYQNVKGEKVNHSDLIFGDHRLFCGIVIFINDKPCLNPKINSLVAGRHTHLHKCTQTNE